MNDWIRIASKLIFSKICLTLRHLKIIAYIQRKKRKKIFSEKMFSFRADFNIKERKAKPDPALDF